MNSIEAQMTMSTAIVPLATITICDLPPEVIRTIFGYEFAMNDVAFQTMRKYDKIRVDATIATVVGRHVCVQFRDALSCGSRFKHVSLLAAAANHIKLVKWAISYGYYPTDGSYLCAYAAYHNNDDMLDWAKSRGYTITSRAVEHAAVGGHLGMIKRILRSHVKIEKDIVFMRAMIGGNIPVLEYIRSLYPLTYPTINNAIIQYAPIHAIMWAVHNNLNNMAQCVVQLSIRCNRVDVMKRIYENQGLDLFPVYDVFIHDLAMHGSAAMADYLISVNVARAGELCHCALANCKIELADHILSTGLVIVPPEIPMYFIKACNIPAVMFFREKGSEWPVDAIRTVVEKDIHDFVKYAAKPTIVELSLQTNKSLINYMVEHKCPTHPDLPQLYADAGMYNDADWLRALVDPK